MATPPAAAPSSVDPKTQLTPGQAFKTQADQAFGHDMSRHLVDPCHIVVIVVEHELDKGLWKLHDMLFLLSAPL